MPNPKRQFVLYGLIAAGVLLGAGLGWMNMRSYVSFIEEEQEKSATTSPVAPSSPSATTTAAVPVPEVPLRFEIVASPAAMQKGLSGREVIPSNYGMLFVFSRPDYHGFWMKDMLVPIDILWLSDNGTVIHVEENVSPDSYPAVFKPNIPAMYVLETKAGESRRLGFTLGTKVDLPLPYGR